MLFRFLFPCCSCPVCFQPLEGGERFLGFYQGEGGEHLVCCFSQLLHGLFPYRFFYPAPVFPGFFDEGADNLARRFRIVFGKGGQGSEVELL